MCALSTLAGAGSTPQTVRKTLDQSIEIQGYPCSKGYAWFYDTGRLERCTVAGNTIFGGAQVPSGSIIVLDPEGQPKYALLSRDWPIAGSRCRGGSWLGAGEGASTAFYPNGRLKSCWLAGDQQVQGVPCKDSGGFLAAVMGHGNDRTDFYDSGKLKSCALSKDFGGRKRGQVFTPVP
jgi:hypothetical protein